MIRAALDSNVLVYAELEPESEKGRRAQRLIALAAPRGVLSVQSLLEFISVVRRKRSASLPSAFSKLSAWSAVFQTVPTTGPIAERAIALVRDHQFQVWDGVIWAAASQAGATVLFSEDMQSGLSLAGVRAANPFMLDEDELSGLFAEAAS
jgi:predicted nucleic acid-binding protein